jgi:two-component system nitrate/nitrite response regulator NarL
MTLTSMPETVVEPTSEADRVTVLIADDHPLFRRGLAAAVRRDPALELVGEAVDGPEALELVKALDPDVAVLDYRMPGLTGVEVCVRLRGARTAVLLLSAFEDGDLVTAALGAGAAGYVGKSASQWKICDAIGRVARGGIAFELEPRRRVSIADDRELF